MSALGSLTCHAWRGILQKTQKPVQPVYRPGVAGTGLLVGAAHATESPVETDFYGTLANVIAWRDTALGFVGTSQTATDGLGGAWTDVAVLGLTFQIMAAGGLGGTNTHVIRASWRLAAEA